MAGAFCLLITGLTGLVPAHAGETRLRVRSVVKADAKTGRLVRATQVQRRETPLPAAVAEKPAAGPTTDVGAIVNSAARAHGVDPVLVHSVIQVESGYNPLAVSPKGAQGLMQLIPATARRFGASDSFDAQQNIEAGVKYLRYLQDLFKDDRLALAAYNAGEGAVKKYGGIPPYQETENYVYKVGKRLGSARRAANAPAPATTEQPAAQPQAPKQPTFQALEIQTDEEGRLVLVTKREPASP